MKCIYEFLNTFTDGTYNIDKFNNITLYGNLRISNSNLTRLPFKFKEVSGDININDSKINSLENFPSYLGGCLSLYNNKIKTTEYFPKKIDGILIDISLNKLLDIKYIPKDFNGSLHITKCGLENINGCPTKLTKLYCGFNNIKDFSEITHVNEVSCLGSELNIDSINSLPTCDVLYIAYDDYVLNNIRLDLLKTLAHTYKSNQIEDIYNYRYMNDILCRIL